VDRRVWGMSSGGALALEAAASGLDIEKLALYEPPFVADNGGQRPPADHEVRLKEMVAAGRRDDAVKFFLKMMGAPVIAVAVMRWMPFWSRFRAVANTLPYDAAVMGDYSLPAGRIASVTTPTLVIGGEKSDARLRYAVRAVADALPNGRLRMLEGQNHNVSMEVLAPVLEEFFATRSGARSGTT
jgi:pimeloyl-ACP methyl ester carboxylesterase